MSRRGSLMWSFSQTWTRSRACWGRWRRGSQQPARNRAACDPSDAAEAVDLTLEPGPLLAVAHPEALLGREGEDADLALVGVVVDVAGGLADLVHGVGLRQRRVDQPPVDEAVGLPRLLVVGEVRADDPLEVHPQVAVVVLVHVPGRRGAGDDRAALLGHVDAGAEGLPAGVLEDDVDVVPTGQLADLLAQPLPF